MRKLLLTLALSGLSLHGAASLVQINNVLSGCSKAAADAAALTCTIPAPTVDAANPHSIIIFTNMSNAARTLSITDDASGGTNTWAVRSQTGFNDRQYTAMIVRTQTTTLTLTITPNGTTSIYVFIAAEYAGLDVTQVDSNWVGSCSGSCKCATAGTVTTTNPSDVFVAVVNVAGTFPTAGGGGSDPALVSQITPFAAGSGNVGWFDAIVSTTYTSRSAGLNNGTSPGLCSMVAYKQINSAIHHKVSQ